MPMMRPVSVVTARPARSSTAPLTARPTAWTMALLPEPLGPMMKLRRLSGKLRAAPSSFLKLKVTLLMLLMTMLRC